MKKAAAFLLMAGILLTCSRKVYTPETWQKDKITIDGYIGDWPNPLRFYDQESGISYSISNDRYNIYFCCSITNEFLQNKLLLSGLELGIDTLGKKSFPVMMQYPAGTSPDITRNAVPNQQPGQGQDRRADRQSFKLKLLAEAREIKLTGFRSEVGHLVSVSPPNNAGISAAINFDQRGIMNYEAVIPFATFYKQSLAPSDSNKVFNYVIKINPSDKQGSTGGNYGGSRGGGMRGGGMRGGMGGGSMGGMGGGMRGGGMRGGGMSGGRMQEGGNYQRNASLSGTTKTTIKLKLAYR